MQVSTIMVLKVDLQCFRCYKKVKKILCKFPQIQDQIYDEKQNTVTIRVVCCSPEKIKRKIICKGGESIKDIEVKASEKAPNTNKDNTPYKQGKKPPAVSGKPSASDQPKKLGPEPDQKTRDPPDSKGSGPEINVVPPPPPADPVRTCCRECYKGSGGGPCFYGGHGWPPPPPSTCYQYDGYLGWPVYDSYGGERGNCYLVCEENSGQVLCRIM